MTKTYVGLEVSQDLQEVQVAGEFRSWPMPYEAAGSASLCARRIPVAPDRIVIEATDGLHVAVTTTWQAAGLSVAIVNSRHAREFAPSSVAVNLYPDYDMQPSCCEPKLGLE